MIYNLQTAIANLLKTELSADLPQSEKHLTISPLTTSPSEPFPKISIYLGNFTIVQTLKEPNLIKPYPEENRQEISGLREFIQELFIGIYHNDLSNIEKISSLILGIVLTHSDDLIEQYNFTASTQYQSQQTTTTHLISQINILEGDYKTSVAPLNFELKLQVKGQLKLLRKMAQSPRTIDQVIVQDDPPLINTFIIKKEKEKEKE